MLRPLSIAVAALLCAPAWAEPSGGPRAPLQLTAGEGDQLLGVVTPDDQRVYYVSNENGTTQMYTQELLLRSPKLLFDEAADVTWPRVSADGKHLLYISYRTEAGGQVCERTVGADGSAGAPHCREGAGAAGAGIRQALFWPHPQGERSVATVRRDGAGHVQLVRITPNGQEEVALTRSVSSPAVSPDGRWLVYVPLDPISDGVDVALAARASDQLELAEVAEVNKTGADAGADSVRVRGPLGLALPGKSASPTFSPDGRFLYFTQFVDDTNFDGQVDGNDHAVLFRARFDSQSGKISGDPEQLTDASWNCQYPSVGKTRMIMTCLRSSLDLYSLPLDGVVPESWTLAQLADELEASRLPWERLLIWARLVARQTGSERARGLAEIVRLHVLLGEYESATFYARALSAIELPDATAQAEARGIGQALAALIDHRRSERALGHGQPSDAFVRDANVRQAHLDQLIAAGTGDARSLAKLVAAEIADVIGKKGRARELIKSVPIADVRSPTVLYVLRERATTIYRQLDDGEALAQVYEQLAVAPGLPEPAQLESALLYARQLVRGVPGAEADARLLAAETNAPQGSTVRFVVHLERELRMMDATTVDGQLDKDAYVVCAKRLLALYAAQTDFARQKLLIEESMARQKQHDRLLYDLATLWLGSVGSDRAERRHAEKLFRQVVRERGYDHWVHGDRPGAREFFVAVTAQVPNALESQENLLSTGTDAQASARLDELEKRAVPPKKEEGAALHDFAAAYVLARRLPTADNAQVSRLADQALALLQRAEAKLPGRTEIDLLWAHIVHQRYLRTHSLEHALEAGARYHMVMELSDTQPRLRAAGLVGLVLLEEQVGNFELAFAAAEERQKLPFFDPRTELAVCLATARALFHMDRTDDALARSDQCDKLTKRKPETARFLPLVLDREGLVASGADKPEVAAARYAELLERLPSPPPPSPPSLKATPTMDVRNRFVVALGLGAAELHSQHADRAQAALAVAETLLDDPRAVTPPVATYGFAAPGTEGRTADALRTQYRLVVDGLRGMALTQAGDYAGAKERISRRCQGIEQLYAKRHADEDLLDLSLCHARLGENALARKDAVEAERHFREALLWKDRFAQSTGTTLDITTLHLVGIYAELHRVHGLPVAQLGIDLRARLVAVIEALGKAHNPEWAKFAERFLVELTRLDLEAKR